MADGVGIRVNNKAIDNLLKKLELRGKLLQEAAKRAIETSALLGVEAIVDTVTRDRIVKSGDYKGSWQPDVAQDRQSAKVVNSKEYSKVIEYGFDGVVDVKAHTRKNGQKVKAHSRHMKRPARAPIRKTLPEARKIFKEELLRAIKSTNKK